MTRVKERLRQPAGSNAPSPGCPMPLLTKSLNSRVHPRRHSPYSRACALPSCSDGCSDEFQVGSEVQALALGPGEGAAVEALGGDHHDAYRDHVCALRRVYVPTLRDRAGHDPSHDIGHEEDRDLADSTGLRSRRSTHNQDHRGNWK